MYKINSKRSFTDACYYFHYKEVRYESWKAIDNSGNRYLNRYYRVELSTENPDYSEIFLDQFSGNEVPQNRTERREILEQI